MSGRRKGGLSAAILGMWCCSCATMLSGTTQKVDIVSDPPGATARVDGREFKTPATVELKRNSTYQVMIEKEGYEPVQRQISRQMNNQMYWNILVGGLLGMMIDGATGACYELAPARVDVSLVPKVDAAVSGR